MSFFNRIRKAGGADADVKELSEKQQIYESDRNVEDTEGLRQNRVDYDQIAYTDDSTAQLGTDKTDTDALAYTTDNESADRLDSGQFRADGGFVTDEPYSPELGAKFNKTGFYHPTQPAVADFSDIGA